MMTTPGFIAIQLFIAATFSAVINPTPNPVVLVDANACAGSCASTLFDSNTAQLCDQVPITVSTCTSSGTAYGGDVFAWNSNIQFASYWSGYCTNGETNVNLYLYWAGRQTQFYRARRLTSGPTTSAKGMDFGVLLTDQATCPTWLDNNTNVIQNGVEVWQYTGYLYGSNYYAEGTYVHVAAAHMALASGPGANSGTIYMHNVGTRAVFTPSRGKDWAVATVGAAATNKVGFVFSTTGVAPYIHDKIQPIWIDFSYGQPNPPTTPYVYGTTNYKYDGLADRMAILSNIVNFGDPARWVYFQNLAVLDVFYASYQNGYYSYSQTLAAGSEVESVTLSLSPSEYEDLGPNTTTTQIIRRMKFDKGGSIYGHTQYRYDSTINRAAIFEGLLFESDDWNPTEFYVHNIGDRKAFPIKQLYGDYTSYYASAPMQAFMVTTHYQVPNPGEQQQVFVHHTGINSGNDNRGTRVYQYTTYVEQAAYNMGLIKLNEKRSLYLHDIPQGWKKFRASSPDYFATEAYDYSTAQPAFTLTTDGVFPTDLADETKYQVTLRADRIPTGTCYGTYVYHEDCDLNIAAIHSGLLAIGGSGTFWLHEVTGPVLMFYGSTQQGLTTSSTTTSATGYVLSTSSTYPSNIVLDPANTAFSIPNWVQPRVQQTGTCYGAGAYKSGSSDLAKCAYLAGLLKFGDAATTLYVYPSGTANYFYKTTSGSYSSSYTTGGASFMLSLSATPPADLSLPATDIQPIHGAEQYSEMYTSSPGYGANGAGYRYRVPASAAVVHAGLVPSQVGSFTMYLHAYTGGSTTGYPSFYLHGVMMSAHATYSYNDAFQVSASSTPISFDPDHRKVHLCLEEHEYYGATVYGTVYYTYSSNLVFTAYHAGLLNMGECKDVWLHYVGTFSMFYASTYKDYTSAAYTSTARAFVPTLSAAVPANPTFPLQIPMRVTNADRVWSGTFYGCGVFMSSSGNMAKGALMEGLIDLDAATDTTVYLHQGVTRTKFAACTSRGLRSSDSYSSAYVSVYMSLSATPPAWLSDDTHAVAQVNVPSTAFMTLTDVRGTGVYYWRYTDAALAALHEGIMVMGETKTIHIWHVGDHQHFYPSMRHGIYSRYHFSTTSYPAMMVSLTGTAPTIPSPMSVTHTFDANDFARYTGSTLYGCGIYYQYSDILKASIHHGIANVGDTKTIYLHHHGTRNKFYGCTKNGFKSTPYTSAQGAVEVSLSSSPGTFQPTAIQVTLEGNNAITPVYMRGFGYYQTLYTDVTDAALNERLLTYGGTATLWIHDLPTRNTWCQKQYNPYPNLQYNTPGFSLELTSTAPTVQLGVTKVTVYGEDVDDSLSHYGTYVYKEESGVVRSALQMGLVTMGGSAVLYVHHIGTRNAFFGSHQNGISTNAYGGADKAYVLSTSSSTIPVAMPASADMQPIIIKAHTRYDYTWETTYYGGPGYFDTSVRLELAALHAGFTTLPQATDVTLYVYWKTSVTRRRYRFDSQGIRNNGYSSSSASYVYYLSSAATVPPSCVTSDTTWYARVQGNIPKVVTNSYNPQGTNPYYQNSDFSQAAVHAGLVADTETKLLKLTKMPSGTNYNSASTANGVTTTSTTATSYGLTLAADDGGCTGYTFPANSVADPLIGSVDCIGTACATTLWATPSTEVQGTMKTVTVQGQLNGGACYGSGQYRYDSDYSVCAVHAGLVKPGEVKTIYVFWVGSQAYFPKSQMNGKRTTSYSSSTYSVILQGTSTPTPTFYPIDIYPIPVSYGGPWGGGPWGGGYGNTKYDLASVHVEKAAFLDHKIGFNQAPVSVFFHYSGSTGTFFPHTRFGVTTLGYSTTGSKFSYMLMPSATPPASTTSPYGFTLDCTTSDTKLSHHGAGYFRATGTYMVGAAMSEGLCARGDLGKGLFLHDVGTLQRFPSRSVYWGLKSTNWVSTTAYPAFYLSTSNTHTPTAGIIPVRVNSLDGVLNIHDVVYGTQSGFRFDSDLRGVALYLGLIADRTTWTTVYLHDQGEVKEQFNANLRNHVQTKYYSYATASAVHSYQVTATAAVPATNAQTVQFEDISRGYAYFPGARTNYVKGATIYGQISDVTCAAIHKNMYTPGAAQIRLYFHALGTRTYLPAVTNNGIGSTADNSEYSFCISTTSGSHNCDADVGDNSLAITLNNYQYIFQSTSYVYGLFYQTYDSHIERVLWSKYRINKGDSGTFYWHTLPGSHPATPGGVQRGMTVNSYTGTGTYLIACATAACTVEDPIVTTGTVYKADLRFPAGSSFNQLDTLTTYGTTEYSYAGSYVRGMFMSGMMVGAYDNTPRTYYLHPFTTYQNRVYGTRRGHQKTSHYSNTKTFWPSTLASSAAFVREKHTLKCAAMSYSSDYVYGTDEYYYTSELCRTARHAGLLAPGATDVTFYSHTIPNNGNSLWASNRNTVSSMLYNSLNKQVFAISATSTVPTLTWPRQMTLTPNIYCSGSSTKYGFDPWYAYTPLTWALVHAGYPEMIPVTIYLHKNSRGTIGQTLALTLNGVSSSGYTTTGMDGFQFSDTSAALPTYNDNLIVLQIETSYVAGSATGICPTLATGDFTLAALVQGLVPPRTHTMTTVYAHKLYGVKQFYAAQRWDKSVSGNYYSSGQTAYYLTLTSTVPAFNEISRVFVNFTMQHYPVYMPTMYGTRYYRRDTDIVMALIHSNTLMPGETATVYMHHHGSMKIIYGSLVNGLTSNTYGPSSSYPVWEPSTSAAFVAKPNGISEMYLQPHWYASSMYGTGMYRWGSRVDSAAMQEGWLMTGRPAMITVHDITTHQAWVPSRSFERSTSYTWGAYKGYMLSCSPTPLPNCRNPSSTQWTSWIHIDRREPSYWNSYVKGGPTKFHYYSHVQAAAQYQGHGRSGDYIEVLITEAGTNGGSYTSNNGNGVTTQTYSNGQGFNVEPTRCMVTHPPCEGTPTKQPTRSPTKSPPPTPTHTDTQTPSEPETKSPSLSLTHTKTVSAVGTGSPTLTPSHVPTLSTTLSKTLSYSLPITKSKPKTISPTLQLLPPVPPGYPPGWTPGMGGWAPGPVVYVPVAVPGLETKSPDGFDTTAVWFTPDLPTQLIYPGEVQTLVMNANVTNRTANNTVVTFTCSTADGSPLLSDGTSNVTSELTFTHNVSTGNILSRTFYATQPQGPEGHSADISCTVAGVTENVRLVYICGRCTAATFANIELASAIPALNTPVTDMTNGLTVTLKGHGLSDLPVRLLMGPYIVNIQHINRTAALATIPPPVTCGDIRQGLSISGRTIEDRVFGWGLTTDAKRHADLMNVCSNKPNSTVISSDRFELPPVAAVIYTPILSVDLNFNADLFSTAPRRSTSNNNNNALFIEAGAPAIRVYAVFTVLDGRTGLPASASQLASVRTHSLASKDLEKTQLYNSYEANKTVTGIYLAADIHEDTGSSLTVVITRFVNLATYTFEKLIPINRPLTRGTLEVNAASSNTKRHAALTLKSLVATARNVTIDLSATASVAVGIVTNHSACISSKGGLGCTLDTLPVGVDETITVDLTVPAYFTQDVTFSYVARAANSNMSDINAAASGNLIVSAPTLAPGETPTPTTPSPNADAVTTRAAAPSSVLRSVFGANDAVNCTNPVFLLVVIFLVCMLLALVYKTILRRRRAQQGDNAIPINTWIDIPMWRSLLIHHAYLMIFVPCHLGCVFVHVILPWTHILALMMCTAVITQLSSLQYNSVSVNTWIAAILAPIIAVPLRPILSYCYWMWARNAEDLERARNKRRSTTHKSPDEHTATLTLKSQLKNSFTYSRKDTADLTQSLAALNDVTLEESDDEEGNVLNLPSDSEESMQWPDSDKDSNHSAIDIEDDVVRDIVHPEKKGDRKRNPKKVNSTTSGASTSPQSQSLAAVGGTMTALRAHDTPLGQEPMAPCSARRLPQLGLLGLPNAAVGATMQGLRSYENDSAFGCETVSVGDSTTLDMTAKKSTDGSDVQYCEEDEDEEILLVSSDVEEFTWKGHGFAAVFSAIALGITVYLTTEKGAAADCSLFTTAFCWALLLDFVLFQPVSMGLLFVYRWLTSDDEEIFSELHPCHGEKRLA